MRLVFWLLVALVFFYAFYSGAMAVWSYFQVSGIVEQAVQDRQRADQSDRARLVRESIVKGLAPTGLAINERDIEVVQYDGSLTVRIRWTYPIIVYGNETYLVVPLSLDRSFKLHQLLPR